MMYLLALWVFWLTVAALLLRWIVGGIIDCFKKGTKASLMSWIGFLIGILIFIVIVAASNS